MGRFFKKEINPYSVSDKVIFRNVDKVLTLYVRSSAASLVVGLKDAQERLKALNDESTPDDRLDAAKFFAGAIFGEEQAEKLCEFYGEPLAVLSVCGMYFDQRLGKKITKAQKRK